MEYNILDAILEAHEAEEIAHDCGLSSEKEGAAFWFDNIYYESTWHMGEMPKYNQFIKKIEGGDLYYDYGANYYFLVQRNNKNESKNMSKKNTIRLTESNLKRIISESVKSVLRENNEDRRNFDSEWGFSPERDDAFQEWLDKANSLDIDGSEDDKGEALDNLIGNDSRYRQWYDNMRKKHETNYLWRKHGEFNEHPFKDDEMDAMWSEHGLSTESYKRRGTVRLTESDLKKIISESVKNIISELDYKTNLNAANKLLRLANDETDPKKAKELWDRAWELGKHANKKFHDEYIGNYRYDTMGDKLKGKKSAKFDAHLTPSSGKIAYGNVRGWNKGGDEIFSTEKGVYHNHQGIATPRQHFRDAEIADAYSRANDELWDFENDNYDYTKGKGWHLKK